MPKMSTEKAAAVRRLRRAVRPLLYPTGISDDAEPDGAMRLYLFQHAPGGNCDRCEDPATGDEACRRTIADTYLHPWSARCNLGDPIGSYHGFYAGGIVDDICVGITCYPFCALSLRTLRGMERLVARLRVRQPEEATV